MPGALSASCLQLAHIHSMGAGALNACADRQLQVYGLARVVVTMAAVVPPTAGSTDRPPDD